MSEENWLVNVWVVRIIRIVILVVGWSAVIINLSLSTDIGEFVSFYTHQSNLIVLSWLSIAIIFQEKNEDSKIFSGMVRGAVTLYIFVTFLVYATLLEDFYHPGISAFTNLSLHYLVPILFIVDWIITDSKRKYSWKYPVIWLAYPIFYLLYTVVRGSLTNWYPYSFLDLTKGTEQFIMWCFILAGAFVVLGLLLVFINKIINKRLK